jgi:murein tripeptide amidase MpaA
MSAILIITGCVFLGQAEPFVGRISVSSPEEVNDLVRMGFTIYHSELEGVLDLVLDEHDIAVLEGLDYQVKDLTALPTLSGLDLDPEYHTYEELTDELQALAAQYPDLCRLDSIGCATQFPRTLWSMKLSDNAAEEEDEIALYYFGTHHACEALGCETLLYMIDHFLENYGIDPQISAWMNDYEIFFVPLVNPDGHFAVTEGINEFWRKNARDINNNGVYYEFTGGTWWTDDHEGIDLNRNYDWYWEMGGSPDPWHYYYRGTEPFSEEETRAIEFLARRQRFVTGISFHSYGEVVIYPWNFNSQPAPDQDVLDAFASELANRFIQDNGTPYDIAVYGAQSGQCRNWFYGFGGSISFCVEVNPYPVFLPPGSELAERTERYYNGSIYLLERLAGPGITGHVTDAESGLPLPARVEIQGRISEQVRSRFAEPQYGRFTRLLNNGSYTVFAGMAGYHTVRIENVSIQDTLTVLEIELEPLFVHGDQISPSQRTPGIQFGVERISSNTVRLTLQLHNSTKLDLKIYDLLGRVVATITEGFKPEGSYQLLYDASSLPSGVYFVRVSAEGFADVKKMVLLK